MQGWRAASGALGLAVAIGAGAILGAATPGATAGPAVQRAAPLGAGIFAGSCRRHEATEAFALTAPVKPEGETVRGLPAVSETQLTTGLAGLQTEPHAILVYRGTPDALVACGEIHTVGSADGSVLSTGLFEQNRSLFTGVAVLEATDQGTTVRLYVARALSGGLDAASSGPLSDPSAEVTDTVSVTLREFEIEIEQTQFAAGSTVQFNVTNDGDFRHELVLEERDALEAPLEIDAENQAETEDLAPGEEASFIYTFDEPGSFQLADHVSNYYQRGMVVEIEVI